MNLPIRHNETEETKMSKAKISKPAAAPVTVVRVVAQPAKTYRENSARGQYWAAVQAHDGQPITAVAAAMLGTGAKTTAATNSWLAWFAKQGLITIGA